MTLLKVTSLYPMVYSFRRKEIQNNHGEPQKLIPEITFDSTWGDLIARVKNHPNLIFKVQVEMKKK